MFLDDLKAFRLFTSLVCHILNIILRVRVMKSLAPPCQDNLLQGAVSSCLRNLSTTADVIVIIE